MGTRSDKKARQGQVAAAAAAADAGAVPRMRPVCAVRPGLTRSFGPGVHDGRVRAITAIRDKWVNGTVLHYFFFDKASDGSTVPLADGSQHFVTWKGSDKQKKVVRDAFAAWKALPIGLEFKEVASADEAEIRIGFMRGDGSWSWVGREILNIGSAERTMNFGWDLTNDFDTALHEIGHTLGMHHEHQNPFAGIVWHEEAVYASLGAPPNHWSRETTHWNIIRKLPEASVQGTQWDADSVMHYSFEAGLIKAPAQFAGGIFPPGGLSARDQSWLKEIYPKLGGTATFPELKLLESRPLSIRAGQQIDLRLNPAASRTYEMRTFGTSDTLMVLFEDIDGELRYRTGDDDSGEDRNAYIKRRLYKRRKYVLRIRMYYADRPGETGVMWW